MKAKECPGTSKQMLEKLAQAHPAEPCDIESAWLPNESADFINTCQANGRGDVFPVMRKSRRERFKIVLFTRGIKNVCLTVMLLKFKTTSTLLVLSL